MKEILMQTYTVALPVLLGYIVWLLQNQKKDRDANSKGTMLLLRVQLIEYHDKYMKQGDIPSYAYENFTEMYGAYHELGGNGMIKSIRKHQEMDEGGRRKSSENHGSDLPGYDRYGGGYGRGRLEDGGISIRSGRNPVRIDIRSRDSGSN